jgi:hypothetical protein
LLSVAFFARNPPGQSTVAGKVFAMIFAMMVAIAEFIKFSTLWGKISIATH